MMDVIGRTALGSIRIRMDKMELDVPDDAGNRHRQMIAEWERQGNVIPPFVPPEEPLPLLTPRQLWLAAMTAGVSKEDVLAALLKIDDPEDRDWFRIELTESTSFRRDHPAVQQLTRILGMPPEQIDTLWRWAATL